jgi:hypothetical protein
MRCLASLPARSRRPGGATTRAFFHGDCLDLPGPPRAGFGRRRRHVPALQPRHPLPVVRRHAAPPAYLRWTRRGSARARVLAPDGSLFLNVGAKPTDPWAGLGCRPGGPAGASRSRTRSTGSSRSPSTGRRRRRRASTATSPSATTSPSTAPASSTTATSTCSISRHGETALDRTAIGVPYQDKSNVTRWAAAGRRPPLPRQHVVPALRHDQEPRQGPPAPGDVPAAAARAVHPAPRPRARRLVIDPVRRPGQHGRRLRPPRRRLRRLRRRRRLPGRSRPPHAATRRPPPAPDPAPRAAPLR